MTGLLALGNVGDGVAIAYGASDNTIGGATLGDRNIISSNTQAGVAILSPANVVQGNLIGINSGGSSAIGNGTGGIFVGPSGSSAVIGGTSAHAANIISGNNGAGIYIQASCLVLDNVIGANIGGATGLGNAGDGIDVDGPDVIIGLPGAGNIIAGNADDGIAIFGPSCVVEGNLIGTSSTNLSVVGNGAGGIYVGSSGTNAQIGGSSSGARNTITRNGGAGIFVAAPCLVVGNFIGTDAAGANGLGNTGDGIDVDGSGVTIGGTSTGDANVISANTGFGIDIDAPLCMVGGNRIGTNLAGTAALGNGSGGIFVGTSGSSALIGGTTSAAGNIIAGNNGDGIYIEASCIVVGNLIDTNNAGATNLGNADDGIYVGAPDVTIGLAGGGNVISGNGSFGIDIEAPDCDVVANLIGINPAATAAVGNGAGGILVGTSGSGAQIGGTTSASGNIIAGNNGAGIFIEAPCVVVGNLIGTNDAGATNLGNADDGIYVGGPNVTIGLAGDGNIISGNRSFGVEIEAPDCVVMANGIGTDPAGTTALGNGSTGIYVGSSAVSAQIGGSSSGAGNTIVGNNGAGIFIQAPCLVLGNFIGTDSAGGASLGNLGDGIDVDAPAVTIGAIGAGNVISGNAGYGIDIEAPECLVQANIIGANASGSAAIGNVSTDIHIGSSGSSAQIGGSSSGEGNTIVGNNGAGIYIQAPCLVAGNLVGTNAAGATNLGNMYDGIDVDASNVTIGGPNLGQGNVISGNGGFGVSLSGPGTTDNVLLGNMIGTDPTGAAALGNGSNGIDVSAGASNNSIGGPNLGDGNVISGNDSSGVFISDNGTTGNQIAGNFIGTDATGSYAIGNAFQGIFIGGGASFNLVGPGNVISGNDGDGIDFSDSGTILNVVADNLIGTDITGSYAVPNGGIGVNVYGQASDEIIGLSGAGNLISGNLSDGIDLDGTGTNVNTVDGNLIGTDHTGGVALANLANGIAIGGGSSANDVLDNTVSGNDGDGIYIFLYVTEFNSISGNMIGTDITGKHAVPNGFWGVIAGDAGPDNTVGGTSPADANVISGNDQGGVAIYGVHSEGDVVEGNEVGTDITGTVALPNAYSGVYVGNFGFTSDPASDVTVSDNVISANDEFGVWIDGAGVSDNLIQDNKIGTDINGSYNLGNADIGLLIDSGAVDNSVVGNVISGNGFSAAAAYPGLEIDGAGTSGNDVIGNLIGTNASGTAAVPNYSSGVAIEDCASDNTIGGTASADANVISGNGTSAALNPSYGFCSGVDIFGAGSSGNLIVGNLIGTDITGTKPLGNLLDGVHIQDTASNNTIGGTTAATANIIAFNGGNGVLVGLTTSDDSTGNAILGNSIFSNTELGINLGNESSPSGTPVGGTPSGPNNLQNAPVLTSALNSGSTTTITGNLSSTANTAFRIEFFSNPSGTSQGETYLGFVNVTTNGAGSAPFSFTPAATVAAGLNITATATDPNGNTSEFSTAATVYAAPTNITNDLSITYGGFVFNRKTGQFTQSITIKNTSGAAITGPISLLLEDLKNATLVNQTGVYQGSPYITVLSSGSLGVGQSLTFSLIFADPTEQAITYTAEFLAGTIPPQN